MDSRDLEILRHFTEDLLPARGLLGSLPRSTLYRRLGALCEDGWLNADRHRYALTPRGIAFLAAEEAGRSGDPLKEAEDHLPHLRLMPHPLYRAVLFLIACAISARTHRLLDQHHAGFVIFGRRLKWKTWLGRVACYLAGENPDQNVIYAPAESGRSIHARRNAAGETVTTRDAFQSSVVVLDEFSRADPQVRRLAQLHLSGQTSYPFENEVLEAPAVPILALNPFEGQQSLEGKLGLDEAMLRRVVPVCVDAMEIPADLLTEGDVVLDKVSKLGPVEFREPEVGWIPRAEVRSALQACLASPEHLANVDLVMVAQLAAGATAWLSRASALRATLTAYLTVVSELGWTHADWPLRLRDLTDGGPPASPELQATSQAEPEPAVQPPSARSSGTYDLQARVGLLLQTCNDLGVSPEEAKERLELAHALHDVGLTAEDIRGLGAALGKTPGRPLEILRSYAATQAQLRSQEAELDALVAERHEVGRDLAASREELAAVRNELVALPTSPTELGRLRALVALLSSAGLETQVLDQLLGSARDLSTTAGTSLPVAIADLGTLVAALRQEVEAAPGDESVAEAIARLAALSVANRAPSKEAEHLKASLVVLHQDHEGLKREVEAAAAALRRSESRLHSCRRALAAEEARLNEARKAVAWAHHEQARAREALEAQRQRQAFVHEVSAYLASELAPTDAVWAWLDQLRYGAQAQRLTQSQRRALVERIQSRLRTVAGLNAPAPDSPTS